MYRKFVAINLIILRVFGSKLRMYTFSEGLLISHTKCVGFAVGDQYPV